MSNDFIELLVVLCAIYVVECAQWVPARSIGFVTWFFRPRWKQPWRGSSRWRRGAVVGMPWPPLRSALVADPLPPDLAFSPTGLSVGGDDDRRHIAWEKLGAVTAIEHLLLVDDVEVARFATRRGAAKMADCLRSTKKVSAKARARKLQRFLDARFDRSTISARLSTFSRQTRWLRLAENLLWLSLFVGVPLLLFTPLTTFWVPVVLLLAVGWVLSSVLFFVALRRVSDLPRTLWPDRSHRFMAIASPLATIRSHDLIARELLGDLDPLAIGADLLPRAVVGEQARLLLVDLDRCDSDEHHCWLRNETRRRVVALLDALGLKAEDLLAAPALEDPSCRAYCPRCRTQYTEGQTCPNASCNGISLVAFDPQ